MGDSSESEEFYDAEEFTPNKGSKRSSLNKNINVLDSSVVESKTLNSPSVSSPETVASAQLTPNTLEDDRKNVTDVVQDRKRFLELRRTMQTEEDDEPPNEHPASLDHHTFTMEHPFKIIEHDVMSMQSMTSLGRIGRILSGAADSHPNIRESFPVTVDTASSREPSVSDELPPDNRIQTVSVEPDVIASTKANSVKSRGVSVTSHAHTHSPPSRPPRRRKKRDNLHGSQTLCADAGSVCDSEFDTPRHNLVIEPSLSDILGPGQNALPSPASTIESITRELQDSLQLSHSKYTSKDKLSNIDNRVSTSGSSRSSTAGSARTNTTTLDIKAAVTGEYVVKPHDDDLSRPNSSSEVRTTRAAVGHSSLGSSRSTAAAGVVGVRTRRRSAGDEQRAGGAALARSASGHHLSDAQILDQVTVLNLDTGERMPLSVAEHKLPQCINPLSLHIMRLTSEYIGRANDDDNTSPKPKVSWRTRLSHRFTSTFNLGHSRVQHAQSNISFTSYRETDEESEVVPGAEAERVPTQPQDTALKRGTAKIKRFFGTTVKKTVDAAKSLAQEVSHARHKEDVGDIIDDVRGEHNIKLKASNSHKGPYDFDGCVRHVQEMNGVHTGAVWCVRFSVCGRLLATAGQDRLLRVWASRDSSKVFQEMRTKYNVVSQSSPTPSTESLPLPAPPPLPPTAPFCPRPFAVYRGHTSDLLDVSWSKNYFLLSSSMDKTVRLWHISRAECLCCFQHIDFVTAIVFHPKDDRYFLSGSLDGKLRLWNIPDKKVAVWNEVEGKIKLITAANFCQNGKFAVVGTYDGRCIFYTTDQLKYHTQLDVKSKRGKNSTGRKISGIEPMPNDEKILVTSNDSRIRLYDLRDLNVSCKYKGYVNVSSQIKASFSHDGKYIVSGSENQCIYIWNTYHDYSKFTSVRRDRNHFWEGIKAHSAVVTCAVFAPNPDHLIRAIAERERESDQSSVPDESGMVSSSQSGHVLVSADFNGCIKVFVHRAKPKHSSLPASALA